MPKQWQHTWRKVRVAMCQMLPVNFGWREGRSGIGLGEGYAGEDVTTGAAAGEQDAEPRSWHSPLSVAFAMFTRIPTPTIVKRTEEPPALTKGSGIPFVGIEAVTTATFIAAWRII